jgi:PPOX class probable F420-dependent enzyme
MQKCALDQLDDSWAVLLSTRKLNGSWVDTPVNLSVVGDRAYFSTPTATAKVKRLRNFPEIRLAPCTLRGRPTGPAVEATTRRLGHAEALGAEALLRRKYPIVHRFIVPLELRLMGTTATLYEVVAVGTASQRTSIEDQQLVNGYPPAA